MFTAYGDAVGLDPILAMVFVPLTLADVVASTLGLARRSDRPAVATAGAILALIGGVASLGALALIALGGRFLGLDGWDLAGLTLAALLVGQAVVASSAWRAAHQLRPGLGMIAAGAAWTVFGTIYMNLSGDWSAGFLPVGWAIVAAGWLWIGVATLRAPVSATA